MTKQDITVRLSAKHRANGRHVWAVGIPLAFANQLKETQQRVSLHVKDGKLVIKLGKEGILLNLGALHSKVKWAGQISQAHAHGLTEPGKPLDSHHVEGRFDPKTSSITVTGALPAVYSKAISDYKEAVTDLQEHDTHAAEFQAETQPYVQQHDVEAETARAFTEIEEVFHADDISDDAARDLKEKVTLLLQHRKDITLELTDTGIRFVKTKTVTVTEDL